MNKNSYIYQWEKISPHFKPHEILSSSCLPWPHLVDVPSLIMLNKLRERIGKPCHVNHQGLNLRGVVSSQDVVGMRKGASFTMHVTGKAFDVSCYEISIDELEKIAIDVGFTFTMKYRSWVHMDTRSIIYT